MDLNNFKEQGILSQMDRYELPSGDMIPVLRKMTPAERLETALHLARLVRKMMLAQTLAAHPEWSTHQVEEEVARRILGGAK
jgi:hypothetical protein